jgi:hypothetical protein
LRSIYDNQAENSVWEKKYKSSPELFCKIGVERKIKALEKHIEYVESKLEDLACDKDILTLSMKMVENHV